ncbi:family 43 glycosylhydrolase [Flavihumibacter petaseus]|nr:family 43 glycosylhydrolase [Flavihumibacter petaseus]
MKKISFLPVLFCIAACTSSNKQVSAPDNRITYTNPVFNHDFPDPNVVDGHDGYWYAYSTEADWSADGISGGRRIIPILKSKDLAAWEIVGPALAKKPDWKPAGGIWAPDVTEVNGKYLMYYSFSTWGDPNPGIGFAVADKAAGPFTDKGKLFFSQELGVDNSIDPFLWAEDGKLLLYWGSFHGIYAVELTADGSKIVGEKFQVAGSAYEGSTIVKHNSYYYYFGSVGTCCEGERSTYRVLVGRATAPRGPFIDQSGKPLLDNGGTELLRRNEGNTGFVGTGHNADLVTDKAGQTWMLYHAYDNKPGAKGRKMLLDKISWVNDWPVIANTSPTLTPQAIPKF